MFSYEKIKNLNHLEMCVYDYIMLNKDKVSYMKIRDIAEGAHVSTTTILRFCKKMGCDGYSEFKVKFKLYLENEKNKKPEIDISVLIDYLNRLQSDTYNKNIVDAFNILKEAETIIFVGIGNSGAIAKFGARYFSNSGKFSLFVEDPFTPVFNGNSKNTAIIALSVSGETKETLDMVLNFKQRGCKVISITNSSECSLSKISDTNIAYYIHQVRVKEYFDITSQVPTVCILEILGKMLYKTI